MWYHRIEDGAARAAHHLSHYIPEGLNALGTFIMGVSSFKDGGIRWLLLILGVCLILLGTILGAIRDHDYRHERDKVARLEADNLEERNAMRRVLERLAHELCVELSLWDKSTRVTIYGHIDDGTTSGFLPWHDAPIIRATNSLEEPSTKTPRLGISVLLGRMAESSAVSAQRAVHVRTYGSPVPTGTVRRGNLLSPASKQRH